MNRKIFELDAADRALKEARDTGKSIVLCHGVFDLLHIGHIRHLEAARRNGDFLVVSITSDRYVNKGPDRPVFPAEVRADVLAALGIVDMVTVVDHSSAEPAIEAIRPTVYVKGSEYAEPAKDITGKITREQGLVEKHGGRVVFTHEMTFSSSNLLNTHFNLLDKAALAYLKGVREADGEAKIVGALDKIQNMRILVIGETIIDHYCYVAAMGKSSKESIIATLAQGEEFFVGGVIAAANHLSSICPNVHVISMLGDGVSSDNYEATVRDQMQAGVTADFVYRPNGPTVQKTRFVEPTYVRKLFEVYKMDDSPLPAEIQESFHRRLEQKLKEVDMVIVCDFGHGFLTAETIRLLEKKAPFLAVNAQSNAGNIGYNLVTKYHRADFVCIDAMEARLAAKDKHASWSEVVLRTIPNMVACPNIVVTHGKMGCYTSGGDDGGIVHIPAFTGDVVDTVGAGDAFFVMAAPFVAAGATCALAGFVGNAAGAIKVGIIGHRRYLSKLEIQRYISTLLK